MTEANFVELLRSESDLDDAEASVLTELGIRNYDELLFVTNSFPSLEQLGLNYPKLSSHAAKRSNMTLVKQAKQLAASKGKRFVMGARRPPSNTIAPRSSSAVRGSGKGHVTGGNSGFGGSGPSGWQNIDLAQNRWPIRDQGDRGTCVAFAMAACREYLAFTNQQFDPTQFDLSEQYLYWALKTNVGDPSPNTDGSSLVFGRDALATSGTCERQHWPYDGRLRPGDITHQNPTNPSPVAQQDATKWRSSSAFYIDTQIAQSAVASDLYRELNVNNRPVAAALPVFAGSQDPYNNWNWPAALLSGRVLDPHSSMSVIGGHAVCVTGYVSDVSAPGGGWFVFRNSWGSTNWASAPTSSDPAPRAGYGAVSVQYVDSHCWELCAL